MYIDILVYFFFFFKQKTAYEMRISDWSSDVCSSDLIIVRSLVAKTTRHAATARFDQAHIQFRNQSQYRLHRLDCVEGLLMAVRSEEHTSELQSLMRISYAVFCLKKKNSKKNNYTTDIYKEKNELRQQNK